MFALTIAAAAVAAVFCAGMAVNGLRWVARKEIVYGLALVALGVSAAAVLRFVVLDALSENSASAVLAVILGVLYSFQLIYAARRIDDRPDLVGVLQFTAIAAVGGGILALIVTGDPVATAVVSLINMTAAFVAADRFRVDADVRWQKRSNQALARL